MKCTGKTRLDMSKLHLLCLQKGIKKIRQFLHVNDNTRKDESGNKDNRLYKVQPVIEGVRQNCLKIEQEICHSIDEQIIPAKTKYSGIRQYNPKQSEQEIAG